jgi:hypothetical protein
VMDTGNPLIDAVVSTFFIKLETDGEVPEPVIGRLRQLASDGQLADSQAIEEAMRDGDLQDGELEEG